MDEYSLPLFTEALNAHLLIPFGSEPLLAALKGFGAVTFPHAAAAFAGGITAQAVNFAVGRALLYLRQTGQIYISESLYARAERLARGWALPLLLACGFSFCPFLVVIAAFFNVPARRAFPVMALGMAGYYLYTLAF